MKSELIEKKVLQMIRSGKWQVGDKLPPEKELCKKLHVSQTTLRVALKTIANRGIITRVQRQGSFIAKDINKRKILVLVNFEAISSTANYFDHAIITRIQRIMQSRGFSVELCSANGRLPEEFADNISLESRTDLDEISGAIVMLSIAPKLQNVFTSHNIPYMAVTTKLSSDQQPDVYPNVYADIHDTFVRGLDLLKESGISEFAVFCNDNTRAVGEPGTADYSRIKSELLSRKLFTAAENILIAPWTWECVTAAKVFKDFWSRPRHPRVIFCLDDVLCKNIIHATWEMGLRIPEDLSILTLSNGENIHTQVPLTSYTFNMDEIALAACDMITALQKKNTKQPADVEIKTIFSAGKSLVSNIKPSNRKSSGKFEITSKKCLRANAKNPAHGCWKSCFGYSFVTGTEMFVIDSDWAGRDRYENFCTRFSSNNGETFSAPEPIFQELNVDGAVYRSCELFQQLDTNTNSIFRFYLRGNYTNDADDDEGLLSFHKNFRIYCERSFDGGRTFSEPENISQSYFDTYGKSMRPFTSCSHLISCSDGAIRIPCYTGDSERGIYQCIVLTGRQISGNRMSWQWGAPVPLPRIDSCVALTENSIAELPDGRLLTVMRCDGDKNAPWCKYISFSRDGGLTWSETTPLRYTDGDIFLSPGSCGQLIHHSSGRLFYVTNAPDTVCPPMQARNSISVVEIDPAMAAVKRESVTVIDSRTPDDSENLAISNFTCYEDRITGEIVVVAPKAYSDIVSFHDCKTMCYRINIGIK